MSVRDIEGISTEMQRIYSKMMQALRLHNDIAIRRGKAIREINALTMWSGDTRIRATNKCFEAIKICHNDEKMLIRITGPGILRTKDILETMTAGRVDKMDKKQKAVLNTLFTALKLMEEKVVFTKARIAAEEIFIESPNPATMKTYYNTWETELELDKKLTKKVVPKDLQILSQLQSINTQTIGKLSSIGAVGGTLAGIIALLGGLSDLKESSIGVLYAIALGATAGVALEILKVTRETLEVQQKSLIKLQFK